MRNNIIVYITMFISLNASSQSYLNQTQLNIIVNINNYSFTNKNYSPYNPYPDYSMFDAIEKVLGNKQKKYDYATSVLRTEIQKVKNLELINDYNISLLDAHKKRVIIMADGKGSKVDYSIYSNFSEMLNYVTWIYTLPSVKSEITLLKSVNVELSRIKIKNPDNFYKSERYNDLGKALNELKIINKDSIANLSWKYGLL